MKIGIDVQTTLGQKTGFGFYVSNLVKSLKIIDSQNRYFLFAPSKERDLSMPQRFWWDQFEIPKRARTYGVDILHQPAFSAPILYRGPVVVTAHDLIAISFGKDIPFFSRQYFARWMPFTYRFADHIIAISKHTKKDLQELLNIPESKITVIYLAASEEFQAKISKQQIEKIKQKFGITKSYLLHMGTINPRKNLEFLVKVFAQVAKKLPKLQLVITGKRGWYFENVFALVDNLGLSSKVIFTDYISNEEAAALYQGACLFVFPSLYEGFGLPPLEAMQAGCPVIASNVSSIPEVVGKTGILLSPHDEKGWIKNIILLASSPYLLKKFAVEGKEQAAKFSWSKTAEQTLQVYEKLFNKKA